MALCHGIINPVVLGEDVLVDMSVHPFTRTTSRKGSPAAHVGVHDGIGEEVLVEEAGAL